MDEIHVHKTKKSICAHFAESPCIFLTENKYTKYLFSVKKIYCIYKNIKYGNLFVKLHSFNLGWFLFTSYCLLRQVSTCMS